MRKTKKDIAVQSNPPVDEALIFERVIKIIENRKSRAASHINKESTMMFWEVGRFVNSVILDFKRAAYGKKFCRSWLQN